MSEHQSTHSHSEESIRKQVFETLNKNPLLLPKQICTLLHLQYKKYGNTVAQYKSDWKYDSKRQRGSICSDIHGWRGWTYLPEGYLKLDYPDSSLTGVRQAAINLGWIQSRARNRWLLWRDRIGRLQWFETGRVNLYVRKPVNSARCYQLVCNGFFATGLIDSFKIVEVMLKGIRQKSGHYVFETDRRLPQLTIDLFAKSNGVVIKVGDRTHPNAVEVIDGYPDWAERNERLFEEMMKLLKANLNGAVEKPKTPERLEYIG